LKCPVIADFNFGGLQSGNCVYSIPAHKSYLQGETKYFTDPRTEGSVSTVECNQGFTDIAQESKPDVACHNGEWRLFYERKHFTVEKPQGLPPEQREGTLMGCIENTKEWKNGERTGKKVKIPRCRKIECKQFRTH